jgi:hypothetical protein
MANMEGRGGKIGRKHAIPKRISMGPSISKADEEEGEEQEGN